jgi:hypothetical protein
MLPILSWTYTAQETLGSPHTRMKYSGAFTVLLLRSIKMETNYCQGLANSKADKSLGATGPGLIWGSSRAALLEETFGCSHNFCHYANLGIGKPRMGQVLYSK